MKEPLSIVGATPVITAAPVTNGITCPLTITLGAEPIIKDSPVGVITCPVTKLGALPTKVNAPTAGVMPLSKNGAEPTSVNAPTLGVMSIFKNGAAPTNVNAPTAGVMPIFKNGAAPTKVNVPVSG